MWSFYGKDNDMDNLRYCTLKQACASGSLATVQSILQANDSAGQRLPPKEHFLEIHLQKCLFTAFANSHFDVARYLIREAAVKWKPIEQKLVWHAVTHSTQTETFEFLVQEGWEINSPLRQSDSALCFRHVLDSFPLVKWLVENGADPNLGPDSLLQQTKNDPGMVPDSGRVLEIAACTNPATAISLIKYLLDNGLSLKNGYPLHSVSQKGPYDPDREKQSPAGFAAQWHQDTLDNKDPLDIPASASRIPVIRYLLDLGFDPNASDAPRRGSRAVGPPLHCAIRGCSVENAQFLLENGADPWSKNHLGQSTLEAARYGEDVRRTDAMQQILRQYM